MRIAVNDYYRNRLSRSPPILSGLTSPRPGITSMIPNHSSRRNATTMMIMRSIMIYNVLLNFQVSPNDAVSHKSNMIFLKSPAIDLMAAESISVILCFGPKSKN